jgi:hypothetical protein
MNENTARQPPHRLGIDLRNAGICARSLEQGRLHKRQQVLIGRVVGVVELSRNKFNRNLVILQ